MAEVYRRVQFWTCAVEQAVREAEEDQSEELTEV